MYKTVGQNMFLCIPYFSIRVLKKLKSSQSVITVCISQGPTIKQMAHAKWVTEKCIKVCLGRCDGAWDDDGMRKHPRSLNTIVSIVYLLGLKGQRKLAMASPGESCSLWREAT